MTRTRSTKAITAALALGLSLGLAACGGGESEKVGAPGAGAGGDALAGATLTVGSKEFTESIILGKITALAMTNAGAKVTDKTGISGSATVREALVSKEIDMYWDYTGTGWVNILKNDPTDLPDDLYQAVATADKKNGIAWLKPAPFENAYAIAVSKAFAEENNVKSMGDAVTYIKANPGKSSICAASEFLNRDDGLPGLQKAYGIKFSSVQELDFNLIFTQVGKTCPFAEVTTTEGRVKSNDLQILEDDKNFFLEYRGLLTLRQETLDANPKIAEIIAPISEKLTNEKITELNAKVDVDGEEPQAVAEQFMKDEGLAG